MGPVGYLQRLSWIGWTYFQRTSLSWAFFWTQNEKTHCRRQTSASTNTKQFCLMQDLNTLHQFLKTEVLYSCEDLVIHHHYKWNILKMYQLVHPLYYSHFLHFQSQLKSPASPGYSINQKRPLWLTLYYHREPNYIVHQLLLLWAISKQALKSFLLFSGKCPYKSPSFWWFTAFSK